MRRNVVRGELFISAERRIAMPLKSKIDSIPEKRKKGWSLLREKGGMTVSIAA